jgi:hypothetical protein
MSFNGKFNMKLLFENWRKYLKENDEEETLPDFLWHGSAIGGIKQLEPRQAVDISGRETGNKKAVYATPDKDLAIALSLPESGADSGMNLEKGKQPKVITFDGKLRKGEKSYLYKLPTDTFENTHLPDANPEWISYEPVTPIGVEEINVDDYLDTHVQEPSPEDLEMWNKYNKTGKSAE